MNNLTVNGLWIGGTLSPLEILTIRSFQANGYTFHLWHYEPLENIPESTILKDATLIIPKKDVFAYKNANKFGHGAGSYAGFSDIFRYKLLFEQGGIWVDMDVTCLQPLPFSTDYVFRFHHQSGVVGNYMKCPPKSDLMKWCYEQAIASMNADNEDWMLPIRILYQGIHKFKLEENIQDFSNPDSFPVVSKLIRKNRPLPKKWFIIHWMNEEFRRIGINKNQVVENSRLHELMVRYNIPITVLKGADKNAYLLKLSRLNYVYLSLTARVNYLLKSKK